MNRLLCYGGFSIGFIMLIVTIVIWFRLHVYKAFVDVLDFGSNRKWLKRSSPGRENMTENRTSKISKRITAGLDHKTEETTLLKNYDFKVIEEIVFVHTNEEISVQ